MAALLKNLEPRCHVRKKNCQKTASVTVPVGGPVQRGAVAFTATFNGILPSQEEESVVEDEICVRATAKEDVGSKERSLLWPQKSVARATRVLMLGPQRIGIGDCENSYC